MKGQTMRMNLVRNLNLVKKLNLVCSLIAALFLFPLMSFAGDVELAWDANVETELAGYRLHYGNVKRPPNSVGPADFDYGNMIDVLNVVTFEVTGLSESSQWCFAVTAYGQPNTGVKDSGFSNEVCMEFKILGNPKNTRIIKITIQN